MRRLFIALTMLVTMTMTTHAMSYEQARQQALFLTDKMAYELNLTEEQYEAAYEVNLDYLMSVNTQADLYGAYWTQRNLDLSYILFDWQYQAYLAATYFYRPLYWEAGYWHFGIYARYPYRDYFYFGRPHFWTVYRGGHSWRMNGGRSWYHGRSFGHHDGGRHHGMRDRYDRGDYGRGHGGGSFDHNRGGNGGRGNGGFGNGRSRGNGGVDNGRPRDNGGRGNGGFGNGRSRGNNGTPSTIHSQNDRMAPNSSRSTIGSRESSTRQTPGVAGGQRRDGSVGNTPSGTFSRSGSSSHAPSSGSRMTAPSRSTTSPSRSMGSGSSSPSRSFGGSHSSSPSRSFGGSSSSPSRSFGGSSSSPSRSFGGGSHSSSPSRSFGGGSSSPSRSLGGGSHSGGGRSFGGGSHGGGSHGGGRR